jgi:hypothetical protein
MRNPQSTAARAAAAYFPMTASMSRSVIARMIRPSSSSSTGPYASRSGADPWTAARGWRHARCCSSASAPRRNAIRRCDLASPAAKRIVDADVVPGRPDAVSTTSRPSTRTSPPIAFRA